ncbi:MAG: hypothetical protein ACR2F2_06180 [Pyrinomonadaceae bacterium]
MSGHQKQMMFNQPVHSKFYLFLFLSFIIFLNGCGVFSPKESVERAKLLKTEEATQTDLIETVNRFAKVNSMRAKMYLKFEDNSYAEVGLAEKYKTADGEIVVQRPANILLKVQLPIVKSDIVQMASNGEKFCVAILNDGGSGKYKKFVCGTNSADYTRLQQEVEKINGDAKELKQNVNAFSNLRPQHFTEAVLVRPIDTEKFAYLTTTISQEEFDLSVKKKSPLRWVLRGYYLLDEIRKNDDGTLSISRRFWFDRVGSVRLARQQIFDAKGEIESDIVYGKEGNLTDTGEYNQLPLRIEVTRPKEKYKMSLTYQSPESVSIGKTYPDKAFNLENTWNLEEVDLDKKLLENKNAVQTAPQATASPSQK